MNPIRSDEVDATIKIPLTGENVMQKVTFTVAIVPNTENTPIGLLIRLLVHDSSWNMGKFFQTLIKQCHSRAENGQVSYYREPWPQYAMLQGTNHPVHEMTHDRWMQCVNDINGERPNFAKRVLQNGQYERMEAFSSPCHPKNVYTLSRALKRLHEAGGVLCTPKDVPLYGGGGSPDGIARWPFPKTVRYQSKQVFWFHPRYSGFMNQYIPFSTSYTPDGGECNCELYGYLRHTDLYSKDEIRALSPKFSSYKTGNLFVHWAIDADVTVDKLDRLFPTDYYETYQRYLAGVSIGEVAAEVETYQREVRRQSAAWMGKFRQLCQLEGSSEFIPISKAGRATLEWYQAYLKGKPKLGISREVEMYDGELDLFSNWVLRQMAQYEKFAKMVQPIVPFKVRGCFSVYQRRNNNLLYNVNFYGGPGSGKSFAAIDFTKKVSIPDTVSIYSRVTAAADQTDQAVDDEIRGIHEMPEVFVSAEQGRKHPDMVNQKKDALTSGQLAIKVFEHQTIAGVPGKFRSARTVVQSQNYTEVTCCNVVPDEGALGTRYHNVLVGDSNVPIHEVDNVDVWSDDKKEVADDYRVGQFLSFWTEKAMAIYAIPCRAPFMGLYNDISARMIDSLCAWGALARGDQFARCKNLMDPMARQLTIDKAALLTFHTRGGAHFGKRDGFDPGQLTAMAPLLYCDSNITLFAWTLHSSDWIRSDYGKILEAAWKISAGSVAWDSEKSMYQYYQEDTEKLIRFKTVKNLTWCKEDYQNKNKTFTDLNMIDMGCSLEHAAQKISAVTENPKIPTVAVKGILEQLCKRPFTPRSGGRNGYMQTLFTDDLTPHKGKRAPNRILTVSTYRDMLKAWCRDISLTFYQQAMLNLGLNIDTFTNSRGLLESMTQKCEESIVFIGLLPPGKDDYRTIPGEMPESPPIVICDNNLQKISTANMMLIVQSFGDLSLGRSNGGDMNISMDPYSVIPNMTFRDAILILHGFKVGIFRKFGNDAKSYLKLDVIHDPMGIDFPKFPSEAGINMLEGVPPPPPDCDISHPKMINIVEIGRGKLYFSPMAIGLFDKSIVQDAFIDAVMCSSTSPGKRMVGWTDERDATKFKTFRLTAPIIAQKVKEFDDDAEAGAKLRANGIAFNRRGHIESSTKQILYGIDSVSGVQREKYKSSVEVIDNLDKWAATRQYLICGIPWTEPVRDPDWIRANYIANGGKIGKVDYPDTPIREKMEEAAKNLAPNAAESRKKSRKISKI